MAREFNSYKGLQKPLVFKMFKGKYIYRAFFVLIGSLFLCAIVGITISLYIGLVVLLISSLGGLFIVLKKQKKTGLYSKDLSEGLYIVTNYKLTKFER